ncbi:hypothetical protein Tco_0970698 [Tanacetum coccineum]
MQISAFMSNSKCPKLARRFFDQVPRTVTEMMKRVDDFIKSKEVYKSTEFPRGEIPDKGQGAPSHENKLPRVVFGEGWQRTDIYNNFNNHIDHYQLLEALTKRSKEILATELQLQLPLCPPMLEITLESGKLSHIVKDVKKRVSAKGRHHGNNNGKVEAGVEGYLVRRVFVDQGAVVQVMFEHCFDNLSSSIKACLTQTLTELVGFYGEQLIPIGKIELEVAFGNRVYVEGL